MFNPLLKSAGRYLPKSYIVYVRVDVRTKVRTYYNATKEKKKNDQLCRERKDVSKISSIRSKQFDIVVLAT